MKRFRGDVHFGIFSDFYISPALILTINNVPSSWDGTEQFYATRLIGLRCRFMFWDLSACVLIRGKETAKPKSVLEEVLEKSVHWWENE